MAAGRWRGEAYSLDSLRMAVAGSFLWLRDSHFSADLLQQIGFDPLESEDFDFLWFLPRQTDLPTAPRRIDKVFLSWRNAALVTMVSPF